MATGLATRCPACATVFRVVPDQLRVSDGWVRCGRCSDVFNASLALIDLATGAARRPGADGAARRLESDGAARRPGADNAPPPPAPTPADFAPRSLSGLAHDADGDDAAGHDDDAREGPPTTVPVIDSTESRFVDDLDLPNTAHDRAFDSTAALAPGATHALDDPPHSAPAAAPDDGDDGLRADPRLDPRFDPHGNFDGSGPLPQGSLADSRQTPSFVRRADRAQRWRQPRVRAALAGVAVLAALALAAQVAHAYRDLLAARLPAARTVLQQACGWLGCSVGAPHAIDSFSVESSGLLRVEKSSLYKLSVALRNRAAIEVALPAVELALTDSQGRLLARRVLRPAELGSAQTTLGAGRDLVLQATLQTALGANAAEAVAGYTVEIFYP